VGHVLAGFALEQGSNGLYIWRYHLPLYDRIPFISFLFGDRLPNESGIIRKPLGSIKSVADEFLARVMPHERFVRENADPVALVRLIERSEALGNVLIRRGLAVSLIMCGAEHRAAEELCLLREQAWRAKQANFAEEISEISAALAHGVFQARALLLSWEAETRRRLQID
jgi:hypothetical protein